MTTEFITPMKAINSIGELNTQQNDKTTQVGDSMFKSIFDSAVDGVKDTQKNLEEKQYLLATGQLTDPHTVTVAAAEAQLSVDLLVQLRNKSIEAYNELIKINL